jgi:propanediol dehydratase small subunit
MKFDDLIKGEKPPKRELEKFIDGTVVRESTSLTIPSVPAIRETIKQLDVELALVTQKIQATEIVDNPTKCAIIDTRDQARSIFKEIERAVDIQAGPVKKVIQEVNKLIARYRDSTKEIVDIANQKIDRYQSRLFIQEQEERRKQQAIIDAENKRLAALAKEKNVIAPPEIPPVPIPEKPQKKLVSDSGASVTRVDHWVFETVNKEAVPEEYKMVDDKAVNAAIRQGVREIPGLVIKNEPYYR